ncbi:hypothetical protein C3L33_15713, partial [Rhododendron williamsianum]
MLMSSKPICSDNRFFDETLSFSGVNDGIGEVEMEFTKELEFQMMNMFMELWKLNLSFEKVKKAKNYAPCSVILFRAASWLQDESKAKKNILMNLWMMQTELGCGTMDTTVVEQVQFPPLLEFVKLDDARAFKVFGYKMEGVTKWKAFLATRWKAIDVPRWLFSLVS